MLYRISIKPRSLTKTKLNQINRTNATLSSIIHPLLILVSRRKLHRRALRLGGRDRSIGARSPISHRLEAGGRSAGTADGELLAIGAAHHGAGGGAGAA